MSGNNDIDEYSMKPVFIYDAIRSARTRAKASGGLHPLTPPALLAQLYATLIKRTGLEPALVTEVILGCVTQQGEQAGNIAKTSALYAGLPSSVAGMTINRFCSSSMDAIGIAALKVAAGQTGAVIAGGIEMMSRVPLLADGARVFTDMGYGIANQTLLMGSGADLIATRSGISREQCDAVALQSQRRAETARTEGRFTSIVPVEVNGDTIVLDECIRADLTAEQLAALPPAFADLGAAGADAVQIAASEHISAINHVHTAGNSPAMCDGASLLLIGDASLGQALGLKPRARIVATTTACGDPLEVLAGCIPATQQLLQNYGCSVHNIDLFEIHEAFAATVVKLHKELAIDDTKLNVNGGVIALGHPMGATGAIMTGTLLDELERQDLELGVVATSGAAGSGSALLLQR